MKFGCWAWSGKVFKRDLWMTRFETPKPIWAGKLCASPNIHRAKMYHVLWNTCMLLRQVRWEVVQLLDFFMWSWADSCLMPLLTTITQRTRVKVCFQSQYIFNFFSIREIVNKGNQKDQGLQHFMANRFTLRKQRGRSIYPLEYRSVEATTLCNRKVSGHYKGEISRQKRTSTHYD